MSPSRTGDDETLGYAVDIHIQPVHHKGAAVEMGLAERAAYLQFLSDDECLAGTLDAEFADASASATLQRFERHNLTEILLLLCADELGQFLLAVFHLPAVEIGGLLIIVVEHLREHLPVLGVAEGIGRLPDPTLKESLVAFLLGSQTDDITHGAEIGFGRVFPTILVLLADAATALAETGIADFAGMADDETTGGADGSICILAQLAGDALVALAMVIGTDIEDGMVFTVIPADNLVLFLDE